MSDAPKATREMVEAAHDAWRTAIDVRGTALMEKAIDAALRVMHEQAKPASKFRVGQVWQQRNGDLFRVTKVGDDGSAWSGHSQRLPDGRACRGEEHSPDLVKMISDAPEPKPKTATSRVEAVARALAAAGGVDPELWHGFAGPARAHVAAYDALRRFEAEEEARTVEIPARP